MNWTRFNHESPGGGGSFDAQNEKYAEKGLANWRDGAGVYAQPLVSSAAQARKDGAVLGERIGEPRSPLRRNWRSEGIRRKGTGSGEGKAALSWGTIYECLKGAGISDAPGVPSTTSSGGKMDRRLCADRIPQPSTEIPAS